MSFQKSLAQGHEAEQFVASQLAQIGIEANLLNGRGNDLTAQIGGQEVGLEVKWDMMAQKTGNIALEYWNPRSDTPSGLLATTAPLWLHVVGSDSPQMTFLASTRVLRSYCGGRPPWKTILRAGDGNASLWLYKLTDLIRDGIFKEFSAKNLRELI